MSKTNIANSIDPREIEHFRSLATTWWDENGAYKSLHRLNPTRLKYIRDHSIQHFDLNSKNAQPLKDLKILDIGCGGGLLCEPMTRLGAKVRGIDATAENIKSAQIHATAMNLIIDYACSPAEEETGLYDAVLAMEIVEHVTDLDSFVATCARLVRPGGLIFFSTLNRTWKSFLLGIVAAEYILGWVPKGTHQWQKFVTPEELEASLTHNSVSTLDQTGVILDPLRGDWILSARNGVNYMLVGVKD